MSIALWLVAGAFVLTLVSARDKCPVWVPVLLLCLVHLLALLPR